MASVTIEWRSLQRDTEAKEQLEKPFLILVRQAEHYINAYILKAALSCKLIALFKILKGMDSAKSFKLTAICTLQADAKTVYSAFQIA